MLLSGRRYRSDPEESSDSFEQGLRRFEVEVEVKIQETFRRAGTAAQPRTGPVQAKACQASKETGSVFR